MAQQDSSLPGGVSLLSTRTHSTPSFSQNEYKQLIKRTHQRLSQTQNQLNGAIHEQTSSPLSSNDRRQTDILITALSRQLLSIQAEMEHYGYQLRLAEATIIQQQAVIMNQQSSQMVGSGHHGVLPGLSTVTNWTSPPYGPVQPAQADGLSTPGGQQQHGVLPDSPASTGSNPYPETSMAPQPAIDPEDRIRASFMSIFDLAQHFTKEHTNYANTNGDTFLPQELKHRLMGAATTTTAFRLIRDADTRYLLIAKVMIEWIIRHILKHEAFNGLDPNIDRTIANHKGTIHHSTIPHIRAQKLVTIAHEIQNLHSRPDFPNHVNTLIEQRTNQLLGIIRPLMHRNTAREWQELARMIQEAHGLAVRMYSCADEYIVSLITLLARNSMARR